MLFMEMVLKGHQVLVFSIRIERRAWRFGGNIRNFSGENCSLLGMVKYELFGRKMRWFLPFVPKRSFLGEECLCFQTRKLW